MEATKMAAPHVPDTGRIDANELLRRRRRARLIFGSHDAVARAVWGDRGDRGEGLGGKAGRRREAIAAICLASLGLI